MSYDFEKMTNEELNELCEQYLHGTDGVEENPAEAAAIAKLSADRGDAKGQFSYATFLHDGLGVEKNDAAALEYWQKSADQDYPAALAILGLCMLNGLCGVEKDPEKAVAYFKKAAELGHGDSYFHLAMTYRDGIGVEKNAALAEKYLVMAAEKKVPIACLSLALKKITEKKGNDDEPQEIASLLLTAAEGGQTIAQMMYASCCENGIGVEKDLAEAAGWYRRAAKAGNKQANDALINLGFPGVM